MARDPLQVLLRLRTLSVDESRCALAASLEQATAAAAAIREAELAIVRETERAAITSGGDQLVEAFAAWLPGARRAVSQAADAQERAEAEVARCRAELTSCQSALEALATLQDRRQAAKAETASRREQQALDDVQRRPGPDALPGS